MNRYVINVLASQDLNEIADYFAENRIEAGERFFNAFNRKCQQLVTFSNSGKRLLNSCQRNPLNHLPLLDCQRDRVTILVIKSIAKKFSLLPETIMFRVLSLPSIT